MRTLTVLFTLLLPIIEGCAVDNREDPTSSNFELASKPAVPVYLNHTMGVFPQATIDAVQNNAYLSGTFVDVEVRTTVRPDITYTGTYLNGRITYLELFAEGTLGFARNVFQLALSDEVTGGAEVVQQKWNQEFNESETEIPLIYRHVNGVDVPWFRAVVPTWANTTESVALFDGEYVPNPGATVPRTRLEERAGRYQPTKLVRDVQAFVYGAPAGEIDLLRRAVASVGWSVLARDHGFLALSPLDDGTRRAILVAESTSPLAGLRGALFRLNRYAHHTEPLNEGVLKVGIFGRPYAMLWLVAPSPDQESDIVSAVAP